MDDHLANPLGCSMGLTAAHDHGELIARWQGVTGGKGAVGEGAGEASA